MECENSVLFSKPAGILEELTHATGTYHWDILMLCEVRWKTFGEIPTDDGHKVYFSGISDRHDHGVNFFCIKTW